MKIYVGNLGFNATEEQIRKLFAQHGQVQDAYIVKERGTEKPRGFAFVMMPDGLQAKAAIAALKGYELDGRSLAVSEAKSKAAESAPRPGRRGSRPGYAGRSGRVGNRRMPR